MSQEGLSADQCKKKAIENLGEARNLTKQNSKWSYVVAFYAAYHAVKYALLTDPIFDDFQNLKSKDSSLVPEDRTATRHSKRAGSDQSPGINDIVRVLYRTDCETPIYLEYFKLHSASIVVRYKDELPPMSMNDSLAYAEKIVNSALSGRIRAEKTDRVDA
ncbi:hypothetical protein [Rothia dentocariosa]|jgi:hypothetical protein|uniref:Uncharacterized protein n=1 Tax=Rothia dentocariosa TaxID=2047 RepID=A0A7D4GUK7_9MICC|nr:hypothetical protein [Rothia dentocariosa]EFJ78135.1 hypothetical protein HMPREF0734_01189 [Rothia dentocariosa M567]MBF1649538.1 hypothetical protein [Rothia dentocariosa]QKI09993.1 hypothetical protein FOC60_09125 [Rothia dentocariosa]